jgi:hypothetical protein
MVMRASSTSHKLQIFLQGSVQDEKKDKGIILERKDEQPYRLASVPGKPVTIYRLEMACSKSLRLFKCQKLEFIIVFKSFQSFVFFVGGSLFYVCGYGK